MMQVIPKWKVSYLFGDFKDQPMFTLVVYVYDFHLSNVLKKIAELSFERAPQSITIMPCKDEFNPQTGSVSGLGGITASAR